MKKSLKESAGYLGILTPKPINRIKLSTLAKEAWEPTKHEEPTMTPADKKKFMEAISNFNKIGEAVYRPSSLKEVTEHLKELVEAASHITMTETEDWFDRVTVQRHMKQLGESYKTFEKTAKQISELQQRLEACYEDMGTALGKYYKINPTLQESDGSDYEKFFNSALAKFGVTSPAEIRDNIKKKEFFKYVDNNWKSKEEK